MTSLSHETKLTLTTMRQAARDAKTEAERKSWIDAMFALINREQ